MIVAVLAALCAGACFAVAGVLQQRVASTRPDGERVSPRLLLDLLRQRVWLVGIGLAALSYVFQSVALAFGPLSLVQPLIVSELVFAIPLSARLHRIRLGTREWVGAVAVAVGLAGGLFAASPSGGNATGSPFGWLITIAVVAMAVGISLFVSRCFGDNIKASLVALAGGAIMGTQSALLDSTIHRFEQGLLVVFTAWQTYLLVVASIGGLVLIQSAFQAGPLAASLPVIDATEPAVAIAIGVALFGERIHVGPFTTSLTVLGLIMLFTGIVVLDTSPLMKELHRKETRERPEDSTPDSQRQVHIRDETA